MGPHPEMRRCRQLIRFKRGRIKVPRKEQLKCLCNNKWSALNIHVQATLKGLGEFYFYNYSLCAHTYVEIIIKDKRSMYWRQDVGHWTKEREWEHGLIKF